LDGVLMEHIVLDSNELRQFLTEEIRQLQDLFITKGREEEHAVEFLKALEGMHIQLDEDDKSYVLRPCETRQDFALFISAIYKILHDRMKIKNEEIDAMRCYFHHNKTGKEQEWYEKKFEGFCRVNVISFPPQEDEWRLLKEKVLEQSKVSLSRYN